MIDQKLPRINVLVTVEAKDALVEIMAKLSAQCAPFRRITQAEVLCDIIVAARDRMNAETQAPPKKKTDRSRAA